MTRIVFSLLLSATFLLFGGDIKSYAQSGSQAYVITDVKADASDESSVKARNKAFAEAQVEAFKILATRLGKTVTTPPESQVISSLVKDFEIKNEQLSSKRYRGTFTFRFREGAVNRYFGTGRPTSFEEKSASSGQTLILPFITTEKNSILWDKSKNKYWESLAAKNTDIHIIYPEGTVLDATDVWEKDPNMLSMSSIRKIRERYHVDEVIVAVLRSGTDDRSWMIDLYRTDRSRIELVKTLPVSLTKTNTDDTLFTNAAATTLVGLERLQSEETLTVPIDEAEQQIVTEEVKEKPPATSPVTVTPIDPVTNPIQRPEKPEKKEESIPQTKNVRILASFQSLRDWTLLQSALRSSPSLSRYKLISMKTTVAELEISSSDWQKGAKELQNGGYVVEPVIDGSYRIHR